jgi:hypothetical protein
MAAELALRLTVGKLVDSASSTASASESLLALLSRLLVALLTQTQSSHNESSTAGNPTPSDNADAVYLSARSQLILVLLRLLHGWLAGFPTAVQAFLADAGNLAVFDAFDSGHSQLSSPGAASVRAHAHRQDSAGSVDADDSVLGFSLRRGVAALITSICLTYCEDLSAASAPAAGTAAAPKKGNSKSGRLSTANISVNRQRVLAIIQVTLILCSRISSCTSLHLNPQSRGGLGRLSATLKSVTEAPLFAHSGASQRGCYQSPSPDLRHLQPADGQFGLLCNLQNMPKPIWTPTRCRNHL